MSLSRKIIIILAAFAFYSQAALAWELKTKYFHADIHNKVDSYRLLEKLNIKHFLHPETLSSSATNNVEGSLASVLDALYLEVSDILDIHMYDLEINLEIVPSKSYLSGRIRQYLKRDLNLPSFYLHDQKTVYISEEDLTVGMLAHEVAHAIVSHYFVVPPPHKIQEVLCGYVEYSIRKGKP
jgi:hypothetical protein